MRGNMFVALLLFVEINLSSSKLIEIIQPKSGHHLQPMISLDLHLDVEGEKGEKWYVDKLVDTKVAGYQCCYSGGAGTVCFALAGDDNADYYTASATSNALSDFLRLLPPDVRLVPTGHTMQSIPLRYVNGIGIVKAWVSHVSNRMQPIGPIDVVYLWDDPTRAVDEIRSIISSVEDSSSLCGLNSFQTSIDSYHCVGLVPSPQFESLASCRSACCGDDKCVAYQWSDSEEEGSRCWMGLTVPLYCEKHQDSVRKGEARETLPPRIKSELGPVEVSPHPSWTPQEVQCRSGQGDNDLGLLYYHLGLALQQQYMLSSYNDSAEVFNNNNLVEPLVNRDTISKKPSSSVLVESLEALWKAASICGEQKALEVAAMVKKQLTTLLHKADAHHARLESDTMSRSSSTDKVKKPKEDMDRPLPPNPRADHNIDLRKVAMITMTDTAYVPFVLNSMASLRINCNMPCFLKVICIEEECLEKIYLSDEAKLCGENLVVHMIARDPTDLEGSPNILKPNTAGKDTDKKDGIAFYNSPKFNEIVKYKFDGIYQYLNSGLYDYVFFTDGDVVYLKPDFMQHALSALNTPASPSSFFDLATQCDAGHQETNCDFESARYNSFKLCTGLMVIRASPTTLSAFDPKIIANDPRYLETYDDQMYVNMVMTKDERISKKITTLDRVEFPNGSFKKGSHFNPKLAYVIHFNFNYGGIAKKQEMMEMGMWYL